MNIRMFPLAHYNQVVNIRRFCLFVCLFVCVFVVFTKENSEYSKVFANPLPTSVEYLKVFALLGDKVLNIHLSPLAHYTKVVNIRRCSLSHYKKVMNIRRFSLPYFKKVLNIKWFSLAKRW